ncbi:MAG: hypothetical protein SFV15_21045 [Polyangiaceae bacterium]|nr:hypothetical protein [Polyangiaceae bacterium]
MKTRKILAVAGSTAVTTERARAAAKSVRAARAGVESLAPEASHGARKKFLGTFGSSRRAKASLSKRTVRGVVAAGVRTRAS